MSIEYQVNALACCDSCEKCEGVINMKFNAFKRILRKEGWMVGRTTLCPECRKLRNEKRRDEHVD